MSSDTYFSLKEPSEGNFRDKGSKFLAYAYPCETEERVKELTDALRKKFFDATHHCYAYRLGYAGEKFRANDDGEPSGSAGLPILGQIKSNNLTNVLIVVVRYYGGTKLGVSGLINAYKEAANEALQNAEIVEKIIYEDFIYDFPYEKMNFVMSAVKKFDLQIVHQIFDNQCRIHLKVRLSLFETIKSYFED